MNPSNDAGGLQVPVPGQEGPVNPAGQPGQIPAPPSSISGQNPPSADVPSMTLPLPAVPGQTPPTAGPQPASQINVQATTQAAVPPVLDDDDLIEKEWVNKAKQIVEKNRNDPHKQSEELTVFRADYMKKRYNKNIKVDT